MSHPFTPEAEDAARAAAVARSLGHEMRDAALLRRACTHASCFTSPGASAARGNERLEFLGDAVLGAALAELAFHRHPEADEGRLSRLRSELVSRVELARAGDALGIWEHCRVGQQVGGSWPVSVRANLVEAILGAIHLDGGWPAARQAVERLLGDRISDPGAGLIDPRMALQEWCLGNHRALPAYATVRDGGTDHAPEFTSTASIAGRSAAGRGGSRRRAEAAAAEALLAQLLAGA